MMNKNRIIKVKGKICDTIFIVFLLINVVASL